MCKGKIYGLIFLLALAQLAPAQNKQSANALLWRITGNGLTKPSYLFGTVHLRNKSLFNFSDSLYHSIENADGFAMELDPEDISTAVADQMESSGDMVMLKDKLNRSDYEAFRKKLNKEFGINADELTVREYNKLREKLVMPDDSPDDMSTFMDAWLYSIAKNRGKTIRGLEDLRDQLPEAEEPDDEPDPRNVNHLFRQVKQGKLYVKQMLEWYLEQTYKCWKSIRS